ncbi:unnamed protein product [Owenia fusiformis]|uniref:Uncharacterized protein n=1 Tax=Owenia fusiformis TaxID=6347 RepID=A0A8S4N311_OWEFU|nr:unnamed protein product [Owenia fusiformis]
MIFMTGCFRVKQNLLDSYFDAPEISLKEVLKSERWVRCSLRGRVTSYQLVRSTGGKKSEKSEFMLEQKGDVLKVKMWNSKSELIVQSDAGKLVLLRNMVIDLWKLKKWNRYSAVSTLETTVTFLDPLVSTDSPGGDHPLSRSPSPLTNTEEPKEKNDSNKDGKEPNVVSSTDNVQDNKADKTALNDSKGDEGDVDLYGDV